MINIYAILDNLYNKCLIIREKYKDLPERDIRKTYFDVMTSQVYISMCSLKIIHRFKDTNTEEFKAMFKNNEENIGNYLYNSTQNVIEEVATCALFQTEMLLRFLHSAITGHPTSYGTINEIAATLYEEILNKEIKDEVILIHLFWTVRNTVHSGGIYNKNPKGRIITYKGKDYKFEFNKGLNFTKDTFAINLVSDLMDSIDHLFSIQQIIDLGYIEHPSYYAIGN